MRLGTAARSPSFPRAWAAVWHTTGSAASSSDTSQGTAWRSRTSPICRTMATHP